MGLMLTKIQPHLCQHQPHIDRGCDNWCIKFANLVPFGQISYPFCGNSVQEGRVPINSYTSSILSGGSKVFAFCCKEFQSALALFYWHGPAWLLLKKSWYSSCSVPIVCTDKDIPPPKSPVSQELYRRRPRPRCTPITRYSCGTGSKKWISRSSVRYVTTFPFPCDPTSSSST